MTDEKVSHAKGPSVAFSIKKGKPKKSKLYDVYWQFAAERQRIFFNRFENRMYPWTADPILQQFKFTNVYRAADRVSQYLIRNVIYASEGDLPDEFFRIMLFKTFNRISTWEHLAAAVGEIRWQDFSFNQYDRVLTGLITRGIPIYSAAYIMASGKQQYGFELKHRNHLALLERMMKDRLYEQIGAAKSLDEVYHLFSVYPTIGDFLAYQYAIDVNYSTITDFSEMDFVKAGPGAKRGLEKCFDDFGGYTYEELINMVADGQEDELARLGIDFKSLWGRPLQLIDCQNVFCEVDKYTRVSHPELTSRQKRTTIKQRFSPQERGPIDYFFPPKWNIDPLKEHPVGIKQQGR